MTHVTLNTDGSLDYTKRGRNGKAGWAYWISSDLGKFTAYDRCPNCDNPMAPELVAIAKGIHYIRNHPQLSKVQKIIVNTDCVPAINWVKNIDKHKSKHRKHKGSLQNIARHHIVEMIREGYNGLPEVKLDFRHCPAHSGDLSTSRRWVNDWLDRKAKEARFLKLKQ